MRVRTEVTKESRSLRLVVFEDLLWHVGGCDFTMRFGMNTCFLASGTSPDLDSCPYWSPESSRLLC